MVESTEPVLIPSWFVRLITGVLALIVVGAIPWAWSVSMHLERISTTSAFHEQTVLKNSVKLDELDKRVIELEKRLP